MATSWYNEKNKWATITGVMFGLQYISNLKHPITYIVEKPLSLVFFLLLLRSFNMYHTHRDNNEWVAKAQDVSWIISAIFSSNQWSKRSRSHYARLILDLEKSLFPSISYYFHTPNFLIFWNFIVQIGKNRNRRKSNLLP